MADALGVVALGCQPECRPARVELRGRAPGRGAESAVAVLSGQEITGGGRRGVRRTASCAAYASWLAGQPGRGGQSGADEHEHDGRDETARRQPGHLKAGGEAADRPGQRRPERQREHNAPRGVHKIKANPLAHVSAERSQAVVAVRDPVADVLKGRERKADDAGHDGQEPPVGAAAADPGQPGAEKARDPPSAHLPGRPGPLAEEEVRAETGQGPYDESGGATQRVAGDQHDVRGGLDVRQRRERDPPERRESRQRGHQGNDPGVRSLALIPSKSSCHPQRQDRECSHLPAHATTSRARNRSSASSGVRAPAILAVSVAK